MGKTVKDNPKRVDYVSIYSNAKLYYRRDTQGCIYNRYRFFICIKLLSREEFSQYAQHLHNALLVGDGNAQVGLARLLIDLHKAVDKFACGLWRLQGFAKPREK